MTLCFYVRVLSRNTNCSFFINRKISPVKNFSSNNIVLCWYVLIMITQKEIIILNKYESLNFICEQFFFYFIRKFFWFYFIVAKHVMQLLSASNLKISICHVSQFNIDKSNLGNNPAATCVNNSLVWTNNYFGKCVYIFPCIRLFISYISSNTIFWPWLMANCYLCKVEKKQFSCRGGKKDIFIPRTLKFFINSKVNS